MSRPLPELNPIPDDIEAHIKGLLQAPHDPAVGEWLLKLIQASSHMNTGDDLRWRVMCIVWLAMEYDTDAAWTYMQWLNMREPVMSGHLSEILIEAVDHLEAHVQIANWLAQTGDARLQQFFKDFAPIPAQRKLRPLITTLLLQPDRPEVGIWLETFCRGTEHNDGVYLRPWRLLAAAWYAASFNSSLGLHYLQSLTEGASTLSNADNKLLMDAATGTNGLTTMIQMIAGCSDPAVKTMLQSFGHPDLNTVADAILLNAPDYGHLADAANHVATDVDSFQRTLEILQQAEISPKSGRILDLACSVLAQQSLLLSSAGYKIVAVDLDIPPAYLPVSGAKQWFKRRNHVKAWKEATSAYYQALEQQHGASLKWNSTKIKLADLTQLDESDAAFEAVVCLNHLHHAPDVKNLLAEAARVLKSGGLFVGNIRPFAGFGGAFQINPDAPWNHLRHNHFSATAPLPLNKWREAQFKETIERYFAVNQWQPEIDPRTVRLLTPQIRAELAEYSKQELTCKQILVVARKR